MRAIVIYRVDKSETSNAGVVQKLQGQVSGLENCNYKVYYVITDRKKVFLNQEVIHTYGDHSFDNYNKFNFFNCLEELMSYDLYIVRYSVATPGFINWLKKTKNNNANSKIVIDMPTYPYVAEWTGIKGKLVMMMDRKYQQEMSPYVDLMIHSGPEDEIYGIPTCHLTNGLLEHQVKPINRQPSNDKLTMVAIGKWRYWHGLDRLLLGLQSFDQPYELHIVGEGRDEVRLRTLADELQLSSITWHGSMVGEKMLDICRKADLAIGTLGLHRKGVEIDSSIKHRTYCGLGIPFVLSSRDMDFPEELPFVQYVSADNSPIDIAELSSFVETIDTSAIQETMMNYAKANLLWKTKMKKVVTRIEAT